MDNKNVLSVHSRAEFRRWLEMNSATEQECWLELKRGKPIDDQHFWYIDAIEEALCFGWIDSKLAIVDGRRMQRFSPRKRKGFWTELNKERVRRLEKLGLMTDAGRAVLPPMGPRDFKIDPDIEIALKQARVWSKYKAFPPLYQRIRAYNLAFYKNQHMPEYEPALEHLISTTKQGKLFGEWNDYGRLIDY